MIAIARRQVLIVVASGAFHGYDAMATWSAHDILCMGTPLVVLQRGVAGDVAILTARVLEHRPYDFECAQRAV